MLDGILQQGNTLGIFRKGADLSANNIANASSPGYARRSAEIAARTLGLGAEYLGSHRAADVLLEGRLLATQAESKFFETQVFQLEQLNPVLRDAGSAGLPAFVDRFFAAAEALTARPSDSGTRRELLDAGQALAQGFQTAAGSLEGARNQANSLLTDSVDEANRLLASIAAANKKIVEEARPDVALGLVDQRTKDLEALSQHLGFSVQQMPHGQIQLIAPQGIALLEGSDFRALQAYTDANGDVGIRLSGGAEPDIAQRLEGGAIAGLVDYRDNVIAPAAIELNQLATDLITEVNTIHSGGAGLDGLAGRLFFASPADPTRAASTIGLSTDVDGLPENVAAASAPFTGPGNNENALLLSSLRDQLVASSATKTFSGAASNLLDGLGRAERDAAAEFAFAQSTVQGLFQLREETLGVSIEEQLLLIERYQASYTATLRVVQTMDEMLGDLLEL